MHIIPVSCLLLKRALNTVLLVFVSTTPSIPRQLLVSALALEQCTIPKMPLHVCGTTAVATGTENGTVTDTGTSHQQLNLWLWRKADSTATIAARVYAATAAADGGDGGGGGGAHTHIFGVLLLWHY